MRIIDAHVHVIDNYPSMTPFEGLGRYDRLLALMDKNDVEKAVMVPVVAPVTPRNNEECANLARSYSDRLSTLTDVPLDQTDADDLIAQARQEYEAVGVSWYGDIANIVEPVWEALAVHDLTCNLHVGPPRFGLLLDLARAYPETKFIINHLGLPGGLDLADGSYGGLNVAGSLDNVFVKVSGFYGVIGWDISDLLAQDLLVSLLAGLGPEKLLWGSDWPPVAFSQTYQQSLEIVRTMADLTEPQRELILGGTAASVYGI
jgi:L-fuconolactonase